MSWTWYKSMLYRYPIVTKATTACGLMSASDILCQTVERSMHRQILAEQGPTTSLQGGCPTNIHSPYNPIENQKLQSQDWTRTLHVALTGATFSGPISHGWYELLERLVGSGGSVWKIVIKMVLDALLFSPIAVAGYFVWRSQLEGRGIEGTIQKLESKWQSAVMASWSFWPMANIVNFSLIPVPYRVLYNNVLSLFWNGYLSNVNNERLNNAINEKQQKPHHLDDVERPDICICPHCRPVRG